MFFYSDEDCIYESGKDKTFSYFPGCSFDYFEDGEEGEWKMFTEQ